MAIGLPRTEDGTVLTGTNKASLPETRSTSPHGDDDAETDESVKRNDDHLDTSDPLTTPAFPASPRRTTMAFGTSGEKVVDERQRAASVTAPGHTPPLLDQNIKLAPPITQTQPKE